MELRTYQKEISKKATSILNHYKFVYLAMEVRTGKTLTSLDIANNFINIHNVLFITKKKAIPSIQEDYEKLQPKYSILVTNYEQLHNIDKRGWDIVIIDEAHCLGAFPKPSKRAKFVKEIITTSKPYVIFLSGTPTPESFSQFYHQVYGCPQNPFKKCKNFYRFADNYVKKYERMINGFKVVDYSNGKEDIREEMKPFTLSYSQKEAGFKSKIKENFLKVIIDPYVHAMCEELKQEKIIEIDDEIILADTPVKLMSKLHQLYSGTVKFESGNTRIFDLSKANFIKEKFKGKRIGVFYKFKAEFDALKKVFGDQLVFDLPSFDSNKGSVIALQIVSGREGISLKNADCIVYYNIDFSATSYWQSRDRMTTKYRLNNKVYWLFSDVGIESKIYKAVSNKKDYTLRHFKKDYESV
tara:strand:+ start:2868 stop:4103 length:1236 start_codon:yes stop_codon:yes gene_type:complete